MNEERGSEGARLTCLPKTGPTEAKKLARSEGGDLLQRPGRAPHRVSPGMGADLPRRVVDVVRGHLVHRHRTEAPRRIVRDRGRGLQVDGRGEAPRRLPRDDERWGEVFGVGRLEEGEAAGGDLESL